MARSPAARTPVEPTRTEQPTAIEIFAGEPSSAAAVKAIVERRTEELAKTAGEALTGKAALIAAVREHATKNRNRRGWATVITMSDADIAALIGRTKTPQGAITAVLNHVFPVAEKKAAAKVTEATTAAEGGAK